MGAQDTAVEEVLRAAAAEVSTSSVTRRLRLFRHTLTHLKASESPSDTALLVDLIFQTLPIYEDRASRKAVDDMVIQALGEPIFMKPFAAALVQCMEKNLKVTNPLTSFKLLRWSHYLLKWSQFATFSKGAFARLANAQAVLCQVLMNGSFRRRRSCKQLFIHLFSEPSGIYNMYMEEVRDSRISIRDSPAFLNLILDFTIASPSLSPEYKSVFLDLYVKTILSSKDRPPKAATEAFKPLFLEIGHEDFKNTVIPSCIKMLKRNPEIILQSIGYLLKTVRLDLSKYCMEFVPVVLHQARHSDEERRINALSIVGTLSEKSSDPDALPSMVNAIKAILGGSEGKLSLPYLRIGMINALEQLSRSPPKQIGRLAPSVSSILLTCYKDDGIEEVKLAILSALGSWVSISAEAVQPDVVSFIAAGLKEKDTLRKGHIKLLRIISKNSDSLTKVTPLLDHLIQLSKTGFSKVTQRLDGIYALFAVSRLAAVDTKADGAVLKEKLWALIAQNEPSLISLQLLPKLADDECLAAVDLLHSLLVEHFFRVQEYFSIQSLLQMLIYLVCHPSWEVRKVAYDATKKVLSSSSALAEDALFLFTDWLSILKQGDVDSSSDSQLPFNPSTEVLVKCLFLIAPYPVAHSPRSYSQLILCSHHPCLSSSARPAGGVYKRLQRRLRQQQIVFVDLITPNISVICKELLSQDGLFSSNKQVQRAALCSLSTLMTITPNDTFLEIEKFLCQGLFNKLSRSELLDILRKRSEKELTKKKLSEMAVSTINFKDIKFRYLKKICFAVQIDCKGMSSAKMCDELERYKQEKHLNFQQTRSRTCGDLDTGQVDELQGQMEQDYDIGTWFAGEAVQDDGFEDAAPSGEGVQEQEQEQQEVATGVGEALQSFIEADELQGQMEQDYDIGTIITDKIIPHAVSWFAGEAVQDDGFEDAAPSGERVQEQQQEVATGVGEALQSFIEELGDKGDNFLILSPQLEEITTPECPAALRILGEKYNNLMERYKLQLKEYDSLMERYKQQVAKCDEDCALRYDDLKKKYMDECAERRRLYNELIELRGNIRVFCRCRPLSSDEYTRGCVSIVEIDPSKETELQFAPTEKERKTFKFDHVFGLEEDQVAVFSETVPVIRSVMDGFDVCIFAYGQTGAGKTFTMEGIPKNRGVNYRALEELFRMSEERTESTTYTFSISILEVYNETIRDLLDESNDQSRSLVRVTVTSLHLVTGQRNRSHMWLVDLAGSERVAKTGAEGDRLKESQFINKSLHALGKVVSALVSKKPHIPYRESKLTHLLQSSLGGDCKTLMFVQISPSSTESAETLCSLNFASTVRAVEQDVARKQVDLVESSKSKMTEKLRHEKENAQHNQSLQLMQLKYASCQNVYKTPNVKKAPRDSARSLRSPQQHLVPAGGPGNASRMCFSVRKRVRLSPVREKP